MSLETNPDTYAETIEWFDIAFPTIPHGQFATQLGVHFEEVAESLQCLTAQGVEANLLLGSAQYALVALADYLKNRVAPGITLPHEARSDFLDSLCDQIVTATGTGNLAGFNMLGAMQEVNRSNFSKFVDGKPVFKDNGKIGKGPNYTEPELLPYI